MTTTILKTNAVPITMQKVLKEVLSSVVPSKDERSKTLSQVNSFLKALNAELKKQKVKAIAVLGGSYEKDTWLSGDYDVDVFVKFNLNYESVQMSDLLQKCLKKWKPERIHGSRDYFWVRDTVKYEIIPVLNIRKPSDAKNVTDFSPLHVTWVNRNGKKFKNDIRLIKKFCKAAKCYGAESYIRGFSGHVVDILTIHYQGFMPLLKAASKWQPKVVLDYNNAFKGKALMMLNKSKTEGPLVLVDPVQPARNAAAALTQENFERFVDAAKSFLKKPSASCFTEKSVDFVQLQKKGYLVVLGVLTLKDKEDVAGTKFVRAFEKVRGELSIFNVRDAGWEWDRKEKGVWWFVLGTNILPLTVEHIGPPTDIVQAVVSFRKKYKRTMVKKGRLVAIINRAERTPKDVLNRVLKSEYVTSRVKKV